MSRFIGALFGVIAGFVLAHLVNETPEGRAFFQRARATWSTFSGGFSSGYRR